MCINCYTEAGSPKIINEKVERAADLIDVLYETEDGGAGGYAHIVTDDWNLDDGCIDRCIEDCKKGGQDVSEETRLASLSALEALRELSEDERYTALALNGGFLTEDV